MITPPSPKIRMSGVGKTYPGRRGMRAPADVDLDVHTHEFVRLGGPSGCGESTLLRMVKELHRPSSGEIAVRVDDPADTPTVRLSR